MTVSQQEILEKMFRYWREIADESTEALGEKTANLFVWLYNDALDIDIAISDAYSREETSNSLVFFDFHGLFKEMSWFHAHFLSGNYAQVYRSLRFTWGLLSRALHADTYAANHPDDRDGPGPSLEDKNHWLGLGAHRLNWRTVIAPTLQKVLPAIDHPEIEEYFHPLWELLNSCVHPSSELRLRLVETSSLHAVDNFDEPWARETCAIAAEVFDLVWLAVLCRFPRSVDGLVGEHAFAYCPRSRAVVEVAQAG